MTFKLSQVIEYYIHKEYFMEKWCRKHALKASSRTLFNFGK